MGTINPTPRVRQVLMLARREAERFNHAHVGTEHLLLGLLALNEGVAVSVLNSMGLNLAALRLEVEKSCGSGGETVTSGELPFSPRARKVMALAAEEALSMHYNFIGTEHLLLAILREGSSKAARVMRNLNIEPEAVRQEIAALFRRMGEIRSSETLLPGAGVGYKFNAEGNQVSYRCDLRKVTTINFDRTKLRSYATSLSKAADLTSALLDGATVNTQVAYEPPFDVNDSFADVLDWFTQHLSI